MKILHIITESNLGGAQRNTLLTLRGLVQAGFDVHLACGPYGPGDSEALIREARAAGATVHPIRSLVRSIRPLNDTLSLAKLVRLIAKQEYDVVHTHSFKGGLLGRMAAWALGVPVIVHTFHGVPFDTRSEGWKTKLLFLLERLQGLLCHKLVSVGEVLRQELIVNKAARPEKTMTIRSGVDFCQLKSATDRKIVRERLGIPANARLIGFVGRLAEQKAPEVLLRAFAQLRHNYNDAHLLFVGEGDLRAMLEDEVTDLGLTDCVHLAGEQQNVPELLSAMDTFALPSRWEGVGRALTEAMYMKLPVVTMPVNGVPELIEDDVTGLFAKPDDPESMAQKIALLLDDSETAARLGEAAREKVERLMSAELMVQQIIELYYQLTEKALPAGKRLHSTASATAVLPESTSSAWMANGKLQMQGETCVRHLR